MLAVSARFKTEVTRSHSVALSAVAGSTPLTVIGGQVTVDRTAQFRRSCRVDLLDKAGTLIPNLATGPVSPYGKEIQLYRGVKYTDGATELCPLGVFRISVNDVEDSGAPSLSVTGYDRSRTISRNRFTDVYVIAAGTNYATAIQNLILNRLPSCPTSFTATTQTCPAIFLDPAADPWVEATKMAQVIGMELFFDVYGTCILQPEPVISATPSVVLSDLSASTLIRVTKSLNDEPGINGVIVTSETTSSTPARGEAWDTDPSSLTYYLGPYGKVPAFETSQYAVTSAQCTAAAVASLQRQIGGTEQASCSTIPNPALVEGDTVQLVRTKAGVSSTFMLESFVVPLAVGGTMDLRFRTRRVA
jgi:hypothetical protein